LTELVHDITSHLKISRKPLNKPFTTSSTSPKDYFDYKKVVLEGLFSHFKAFNSSV